MTTNQKVKLVSPAPTHIMEQFFKAIEIGSKDVDRMDEEFTRMNSGACGVIYELADDYIIKMNLESHWGVCRDGEIMEDLQGLPLVPTVYAYSEDNNFILIQRIKGETVGKFTYGGGGVEGFRFDEFDAGTWEKKAQEFYYGSEERGWRPNDLHAQNCMIDYEGHFWVVDFGLFKDIDSNGYTSDIWDLKGHLKDISTKLSRKKANSSTVIQMEMKDLF